MGFRHVVQQGECMARIARRYGVKDWHTLWDAGDNAALKRKRPDPNVLFPGDEVVIPDGVGQTKTLSRASGQAHAFVADRATRKVKVTLRNAIGKALANVKYRLVAGGATVEGTTDPGGALEADVPIEAAEAVLHLGPVARRLAIGHLNPLRDVPDGGVSGVQARLANLGYAPGDVNGTLTPRTAEAIREFQRTQGLKETGAIDAALLSALQRAHGS